MDAHCTCVDRRSSKMMSRMCVHLVFVLLFAILCCIGTVIVVFGAYSILNINETEDVTLYGPRGTCLIVIVVGTFIVFFSGLCLLWMKRRMRNMFQQYDSLSPGRHLDCEFDRDYHLRRILMNIPNAAVSDSPPPSYKSLVLADNFDTPPPPYCTVVGNNNELTPVPVHCSSNVRQGPSNLSQIVKPNNVKPNSSRSYEQLLLSKNDTSVFSDRRREPNRNSHSVSDLSVQHLNSTEKSQGKEV